MTNGENGEGVEKKGVVTSFTPAEGTPVAIFQDVMERWDEKYGTIVEKGTDEEFARTRDYLSESLFLYKDKASPAVFDLIARGFDIKRGEWAQKAQEDKAENLQEADATVSLRYAELASTINKILRMP